MAQRLDLHDLLVELIGSGNVYFQPPESIKMQYPCIIYRREYIKIDHADNETYAKTKRYQVTVIDPEPDSDIPDKLCDFPLCSYDRSYVADNLNHDVFNLYF